MPDNVDYSNDTHVGEIDDGVSTNDDRSSVNVLLGSARDTQWTEYEQVYHALTNTDKSVTVPRAYRHYMPRLTVVDDKIVFSDKLRGHEITVPLLTFDEAKMRVGILHKEMSHPGRHKTMQACKGQFFYPALWKIVANCVKSCEVCQKHKPAIVNAKNTEPLSKRRPTGPYNLYAVDCIDLPRTARGHKALLVGIDLYTKFGNAVPLRSKSSAAVAAALERNILSSAVALPTRILSDSGPEFKGRAYKEMLEKYNIERTHSVTYMPRTNGGVERLNRTIRMRLATSVDGNYGQWDLEIHKVMIQYNRTVHDETNKAPIEFFTQEIAEPVISDKFWKEAGEQEKLKINTPII